MSSARAAWRGEVGQPAAVRSASRHAERAKALKIQIPAVISARFDHRTSRGAGSQPSNARNRLRGSYWHFI